MQQDQAHTVMVVDDDPDLLRLMSATLRGGGYRVDPRSRAPNWVELQEAHPSMIFMDVELGRTNGALVCKSIKENLPQLDLPIVLISAHGTERLQREARHSHADGFLGKPFDRNALLRVARHYLGAAA